MPRQTRTNDQQLFEMATQWERDHGGSSPPISALREMAGGGSHARLKQFLDSYPEMKRRAGEGGGISEAAAEMGRIEASEPPEEETPAPSSARQAKPAAKGKAEAKPAPKGKAEAKPAAKAEAKPAPKGKAAAKEPAKETAKRERAAAKTRSEESVSQKPEQVPEPVSEPYELDAAALFEEVAAPEAFAAPEEVSAQAESRAEPAVAESDLIDASAIPSDEAPVPAGQSLEDASLAAATEIARTTGEQNRQVSAFPGAGAGSEDRGRLDALQQENARLWRTITSDRADENFNIAGLLQNQNRVIENMTRMFDTFVSLIRNDLAELRERVDNSSQRVNQRINEVEHRTNH
jgi:hypothetical protein